MDGLRNSHPIEVPVGHPSEIDEIFDEISYNKGASVIRMLHNWLGEEDFRRGMGLYLDRHQYRNTETEDLWRALEEASKKEVGAVMSTWVKQMGFPIVTVEQRQDGNARVLSVSQTKFRAANEPEDDSSEYLWLLPLSFADSRDPEKTVMTTVLGERSGEFRLEDCPEGVWVKLNPGTVGYYRVNYSSEMLAAFEPSIVDLSMPPLDRLGLLNDLFAMVQGGHASTVEAFKLMDAYRNEDNYTVWASISSCIAKLQLLVSHVPELEEKINAYGERLYLPIAEKLGWEGKPKESHLDTLLRSLVLNRLVSFNCPKVVAEAKRRFADHVSGKEVLQADLRSACYKAVFQDGDEATFEKMLELYRSTDLHEEKDRISRSLGANRNVEILKKVVQFAMSVSDCGLRGEEMREN